MAGKHQRSRASPGDDHDANHPIINGIVQVAGRVLAYLIITHWRHWGL